MSKNRLAPYINFQGRAREAMEFYHSVFGGTLQMFARDADGLPRTAEPGEPVMHARLEGDGVVIIASDGHPSYPATAGDHIALSLAGSDRLGCARCSTPWPRAAPSRCRS